ncbi:MAG: heme A synthase [Nitrososphaeraceae archaeon]
MQEKGNLPTKMVWLSFTSLSLTYSIMLIGVYITSSHQGLSCPDWPLCPNGFDLPSSKYFFEHFHRFLVLITTGFIFTTAIYSLRKTSQEKKPAVSAAIIVVIQILLGMFVVNTKLQAVVVAGHLGTGMILFAMLLLTFIYSYKQWKNNIKL